MGHLTTARCMFSMHAPDDPSVYKTVNLFSQDEQPIFFISDPPHLIKTIRNCFARGKLWVSIFHDLLHIYGFCGIGIVVSWTED